MGRGGKGLREITWEEVRRHNSRDDRWLVLHDKVYNVSNFGKKHPGGSAILAHYAGQDATEAFMEFHKNKEAVEKYMQALSIGHVVGPKPPLHTHKEGGEGVSEKGDEEELKKDFEELRRTVEKMGLFKANKWFFCLHLLHILFFELMAWMVLWYFGTNWTPTLVSLLCYTVVQGQSAWLQHDFGHLSVFESARWNRALHYFVMNFTKGASSSWWKHLHNQHHSKPNVISKDPDVRLEKLFVLGEEIPKKVAKQKQWTMPYNHQHKYFFIVFFQFMVFKHPITRRQWLDLFLLCLFYVKVLLLYSPFFGVAGALLYYLSFRCLESHWFVWVSQSNHVAMDIEEDKEKAWLALQLSATCDVEQSAFNDWFTGHLNFQIEHHCFPTMPRHNLHKVAPLLQSLCRKHHITYRCKSLSGAFKDIIRSLKNSGEIWLAYYNSYNT